MNDRQRDSDPLQGSTVSSSGPETPLTILAERALEFVRDDTLVGLGAGQAASAFVRALAARVRQGFRVRVVPASEATARLARDLGLPVVALDTPILDVTVDGADEVDPQLDLIKGYGGALVRERILAASSARQIILVEQDKLVPRLGTRGRLPVEVIPFALGLCRRRLEALGLRPHLRMREDRPFVTDNGNLILDCAVEPTQDLRALDREIRAVPGVVDTGLFLGTASAVLVAHGTTIRTFTLAATPGADGIPAGGR